MRLFRLLVSGLVISSIWTAPAVAMTCRDWNRLGPSQKAGAIEGMIEDAISSQRGRSYSISRGSVARCMQSSARNIEYDFDDACVNPRSVGMQELNNIFKNYIWACVN